MLEENLHGWRFFTKFSNSVSEIILQEAEHHYLSVVLRLSVGEKVELINGQGLLLFGKIQRIDKKQTVISILEEKEIKNQSPQINLCVGLPKTAACEELVSLASEIGVSSIHFIKLSNSKKNNPVRLDRLEKIAVESIKINKSLWIPEIVVHNSLLEFTKYRENISNSNNISFICDEHMLENRKQNKVVVIKDFAKEIQQTSSIDVFIGPEASFTAEEFSFIKEKYCAKAISLGESIMRVPTATVVVLSQIKAFIEV